MTVTAAGRSLFATKGRATPVGVDPIVPADAEAAVPLVDVQHAADRGEAHAEGPAGSLLTFRLRSTPDNPALSDELKATLARPKPAEAPPEPTVTISPAPDDVPPRSAAAPAGASAGEPAAESGPMEAAPTSGIAARIDRPLFPRARAERDAVLATRPAAPPLETPRPSAWRTALPIGGAVLAIAAVGWLVSRSEAPQPVAEPEVAAETAAAPATVEADVASPSIAAPAGALDQADVPAAELAAAPALPEQPAPSELPPFESAPFESGAPIAAEPAVVPLPPDAPSFEMVRVAPDAPPVLAGRAAPGSELIVLDNGEVIGTATADANGEWALVTDTPLAAGRHELTLALATPDGAVIVEQADTRAAPAASGAEGLPTPLVKPVPGSTPSQTYVVQLASVPSAADAEREWARLQQAHADQLGGAQVQIDEVEIGGRGTFYRLRTGPFAGRDAARAFCRELNAAGQECLVVRQAAEE